MKKTTYKILTKEGPKERAGYVIKIDGVSLSFGVTKQGEFGSQDGYNITELSTGLLFGSRTGSTIKECAELIKKIISDIGVENVMKAISYSLRERKGQPLNNF